MPQPQSFQTLRQQLDELGYFQILTLDALPLVEAILHDLVGARGKLKAQRKVVIRDEEREVKDAATHFQRPKKTMVETQLSGKTAQLERQVLDMQLLNTQSVAIIKKLQEESLEKSRKIMKLEGMSQRTKIITGKDADYLKAKIELTSMVKPSSRRRQHASPPPPLPPVDLDLMAMYENRNKQLDQELIRLQKKLENAQVMLGRVGKEMTERQMFIDHEGKKAIDEPQSAYVLQLIRENERLKDKFANVDNHTRICLHGRRVDEAADRALYPVPSSSPDHHLHHHHHHHRSCEDVRSAVEQSHMQMHNNCLKNQVHQLHSGALNHEQNHLQEFGSLQKDLKDSLEENAELKRRVRDLNALRSSMKDKIDLLTKKQEILLKSRTPDHDKVQELITYIERQRDVYKSSVERLIGKLDPDGTHLERSLMVEGEKGSGGSRDRVATIHSKPTSNLQVLKDIQNQSRKVLSQQQEGRHSSVQIVSSTSRAETSDFENSYHPSQYRNATNPSSAQSTNASRSTSVGQTEKPSQNRTSAEDRDTVKQILHLESEVDRVKQALSQLRQEKSEVQNELRAQVETLQSENANLRENFELLESQQKQSEKKAKAADMFPSSLSDLKRRLAEQTAAVAEFERQVETKQTHLQKMSDDKDQMQNLLDEKTVQLVEVKQRMSDAEAGRARAEADRTVAEQRLHQCLAELSKQNARLEDGESRSKAIRKRQTAEKAVGVDLRRENESLKDLIRSSDEKQSQLQHEISELNENMKRYVTEVKRIEEVLSLRERERSELLQQYKHLSVEIDTAETYGRKMAAKAESVEVLLATRTAELDASHRRLADLEKDIVEVTASNESYRIELATLGAKLDLAQSQLTEAKSQATWVNSDLTNIHELAVQLNSQKVELQEQIASQNTEIENLHSEIRNLRRDVETLTDECSRERERALRLHQQMGTEESRSRKQAEER